MEVVQTGNAPRGSALLENEVLSFSRNIGATRLREQDALKPAHHGCTFRSGQSGVGESRRSDRPDHVIVSRDHRSRLRLDRAMAAYASAAARDHPDLQSGSPNMTTANTSHPSSPVVCQLGELSFFLTAGPDMINSHLRTGKFWEPATLEISKLLLEGIDHPVVVDIGANLGAYSIPIGAHIRSGGGKLYAFEPQRQVFYQLCANLFGNKLDNVYASQIAIGDTDCAINIPVLNIHTEHNVGSLSLDENIRSQQRTLSSTLDEFESVTMAKLDTLNLPAADLVKIDVEGLELEVLKGARRWLEYSKFPPLLFEVWGDYMGGMLGKRHALMNLVKKAFGYEVVLFGELCIAQHPARKRLEIDTTTDGLAVRRL
jgi:FkbM family methyltransferase